MSGRRKFCSGGGGNPKKTPHKYKKGLPYAEKLAKTILLKYSGQGRVGRHLHINALIHNETHLHYTVNSIMT